MLTRSVRRRSAECPETPIDSQRLPTHEPPGQSAFRHISAGQRCLPRSSTSTSVAVRRLGPHGMPILSGQVEQPSSAPRRDGGEVACLDVRRRSTDRRERVLRHPITVGFRWVRRPHRKADGADEAVVGRLTYSRRGDPPHDRCGIFGAGAMIHKGFVALAPVIVVWFVALAG